MSAFNAQQFQLMSEKDRDKSYIRIIFIQSVAVLNLFKIQKKIILNNSYYCFHINTPEEKRKIYKLNHLCDCFPHLMIGFDIVTLFSFFHLMFDGPVVIVVWIAVDSFADITVKNTMNK